MNLSNISHRLSETGFLLLFPVFFFYHFGVSQNYFPPFLGGLFGVVSLVIAVLYLILSLWFLKYKIRHVAYKFLIFYFAIAFYIAWTLGNHFLVQDHPFGYNIFWESYSTFVIWFSLFHLGFFLPFDTVSFKKYLFVSCFAISLIFIFSIIKVGSFFALFNIFQNYEETLKMSSYQQSGRSIFISFLFLGLTGQNRVNNLGVLIFCALILLSIGSRTDLLSLVLVIFLYSYHILSTSKGSILKKAFICFILVLVFILAFNFVESFFYGSRFVELFDLANSSSWQGRSELSSNAEVIIRRNPILGKFDYEIDGGYAHNILSSWANFGLFGFLFYTFIILYFLFLSGYHYFFKSNLNGFWLLALSLNLITLIQALFLAPIFSPLPALGWGITLNMFLKFSVNNFQRNEVRCFNNC
jgi:hypothetical protein